MKLKLILKKIMKTEGKSSEVTRKIATLKNSKEFNYLVDTKKL
jgi:hypothetical protein